MPLRYCAARMLPITATPTAPPTSRVVSLTAEPTPALSIGSDRTMPVDRVGSASDVPVAVTTNDAPMKRYGVDSLMNDNMTRPNGTMHKPVTIDRRGSNRADRAAPRGDMAMLATAKGSVAKPAFSGE